MEILKTKKGNEIKYYSDPAQLPFERYCLFQKYTLLNAGVGSTIQDIGIHFAKLHEFLGHEMIEEAKKEAENLHFNFFSTLNSLNYISKADASLVFSIDKEKMDDLSDDGLELCIEKMQKVGISAKEVNDLFFDVKKKLLNL